ncbi:hypothetical protein BCON_1072g00010 [Botryotinia convoluta]|uniref:Nucleotidyl transferase AbiEii/AbiGii toxin family protein n=1 Tax=Botryotinia convoluta TaxID=54673 RepID=A0A4Z1H3W0_9HELO|nr:hypothetical protein BCON_1072g00010 [Botryotinia convoluta]
MNNDILKRASKDFLEAVKTVIKMKSATNAAHVKGAFVGGTAVNYHASNFRGTTDIDFQISGLDRLAKNYDRKDLKKDIISILGKSKDTNIPIWTHNAESVCALTYSLLGSDKLVKAYVKIDILDSTVTGWNIESSSKVITELQISSSKLPFANRDDILCTKVKSARDRDRLGSDKGRQDLLDMIEIVSRHPGPVKDIQHQQHLERYLPQIYHLGINSGWKLADWNKALNIKAKEPSKKR